MPVRYLVVDVTALRWCDGVIDAATNFSVFTILSIIVIQD